MKYPSYLKDAEWELIKDEVIFSNGYGNRRKHPHRLMLDAIFYVSKPGCQWEYLPKDFPPYKSVHSYFQYLCGTGRWEKILQKLVTLNPMVLLTLRASRRRVMQKILD